VRTSRAAAKSGSSRYGGHCCADGETYERAATTRSFVP
jgi:hypothetical protein